MTSHQVLNGIHLIELASEVAPARITRDFPSEVCVCDLYVTGAETGQEVPWGYWLDNILNIDHHAPMARWERNVSSANLVILHVTNVGLPAGPIVINHTDCDSILSSGIACGYLDPLQEYGDAAIAADHTGAQNDIADLLQSLDNCRDIQLSFSNLQRLRRGVPLDTRAEEALNTRRRKRQEAQRAVSRGTVKVERGVAFGILEQEIDGEFFPALLPDASVILLASRMKHSPSRWQVKVRLGSAAPAGLTLHSLNLKAIDHGYGGRWNAGSNKRGGGTDRDPHSYVEYIRQRLRASTAAGT
jgi:hypothetical protein